MTNYDYIRSMNVEDMAKLLIKWDEDWEEWVVSDGKKFRENAYNEALAYEIYWLKKDAIYE